MNMKVRPLTEGITAQQLQSPRTRAFWAGVESFARDTGESSIVADVASRRDVAMRLNDSQVRDALIPSSRLIAYNPAVTLSESSRFTENDLDFRAFGYDRTADPRADKLSRLEANVAGEVSRWCCGMDAASIDLMIKEFQYNRGWYSVGASICWTAQMSAKYAGLFDLIGSYEQIALSLLEKAATDVAFYGDPIYNLRGLTDLAVERIRLDNPLDTVSAEETIDILNVLRYSSDVRRYDTSLTKTHMLAPPGLMLLRSQRIAGTTIGETIGGAIDNAGKVKTLYTDYMSSISSDSTPGLFMYARNSGAIKRDMPFQPFMLPPCYEGGRLKMQWVMRLGELYTNNSSAGLMIENALSGAV